MTIDYTTSKEALANLVTEYGKYQSISDHGEFWHDTIRNSVLYCFILAWDEVLKSVERYLKAEQIPQMPPGPVSLIRFLGKTGLLYNEAEVERWLRYTDARNKTAHDYDQEQIKRPLEEMQIFIDDAIALYERLSGEVWQR